MKVISRTLFEFGDEVEIKVTGVSGSWVLQALTPLLGLSLHLGDGRLKGTKTSQRGFCLKS
ncbi:hypothetical protein [Ferrimicrobium acidiphilum]|jgi:hypothetical protein|uniref:hypothetical protein n=1 Tax=Ferrimicrobium acidiphilum TaxID=121039 RepID=UPI0006987A33|nr:hypothetical protein [Ferrimicrobium acidiphilum]MCL5052647.1 hypothetical protein [Gammaproteobacteria bacterium]